MLYDLAILKYYIKFLALLIKGRIKVDNPKDMAIVFSIYIEIRRFCGIYDRENAYKGPIPDAIRHSMAPVYPLIANFQIEQKYR